MTFRKACEHAARKGCHVETGRKLLAGIEYVRVTLPYSEGSDHGYHYQTDFYAEEVVDPVARDDQFAFAVMSGVEAIFCKGKEGRMAEKKATKATQEKAIAEKLEKKGVPPKAAAKMAKHAAAKKK